MSDPRVSPRGIAALPILAAVLVVALAVVGVVYFANRDQGNTNTVVTTNTVNTNGANANTAPANANVTTVVNINAATNADVSNTNQSNRLVDWLSYRNEALGFSLLYPPRWTESTVDADGALNRSAFDTVISEGFCPAGKPCEVSSGYCRVIIGRLAYPLSSETNIDAVLDDLRVRAREQIETVPFPTYTAYRTKVSASPPDDSGDALLGTYYILDLDDRILRAYLESGYLKAECDASMADILSSLTR